jgi:hypothetical protein
MDGACLPCLAVKMLTGERSLLMWGGCCNPLGPPVNLWTTVTVGQRYLVSPLCEVCVSHVFCVIVSVTVIVSRNVLVFQWMCIKSPVLIPVPWCLLVAKLLNALWCSSSYNKPSISWLWSWLMHLHCLACCMLLLWQGRDWTVQLKMDISMNLQFKRVTKKFLQQNAGH